MSCQDPVAEEAFRGVAGLLAVAYTRFAKVRRMPVESVQARVNKELDNRCDRSPHVNYR